MQSRRRRAQGGPAGAVSSLVPPIYRERTRVILLLQPMHSSEPVSVFPGFDRIREKRILKETQMKTWINYSAAVALAGVMALAAASPSEARNGRNAAAIGFGVGALAGAAIASSAYNNGYYGYYEPGYAYAPAYGYDSYAYDSYAYEPAPRYRYYRNWREHNTNNFSIDSQR
jgi:hypothetical protein